MASYDLEAWSERIYLNLPETGMSTSGKILNFLQYNTHKLNGAFGTSYVFDGSGIDPTITPNHSGIYEEFYLCRLFRDQATLFVGANAFDLDLTESELQDVSRQRFVSRNERAKTYRSLAKDCDENIKLLIEEIDDADSTGPVAAQILYSDRQNMQFGDDSCYCPAWGTFSPHNTVWSKFYTFR